MLLSKKPFVALSVVHSMVSAFAPSSSLSSSIVPLSLFSPRGYEPRVLHPFVVRKSTHLSGITSHITGLLRGGASNDVYEPGDPKFNVVKPGSCQFGDDWTECKLTKIQPCSPDTKVFTFGLPDSTSPLNLPTCGCLLVSGGSDDAGEPFIRPYTPVSTNDLKGEVELMVKVYPNGNLSQVFGGLKVGETLKFKHIIFNVKKQYHEFNNKNIAMIVGGTGITPMIQALHAILGNPADDTKVSMLYGSRTESDIIADSTLKKWSASHPDQLSVVNVLSAEPESSSYSGARGFINEDLIKKNFPSPEERPLIFVCGPPPMYEALCGKREDEELSGLLQKMGYTKEMVYKF